MTFEEKLTKLEELTSAVKNPEISLEDALKAFEEGITLAKGLEKEIDEIEGKVQILMTASDKIDEAISTAKAENVTESTSKTAKKTRSKKAKTEEVDDSNIIYDKSSLEFEMFSAPELNS